MLNSLYWVDAGVEALEFDPADERIVRYRHTEDGEPPDLGSRLKQVADRLARSLHMLPRKIRYQSSHAPPPGAAGPYEQLVERGWVKPAAAGACIYRGLMAELFASLDAEFRRQALALGVEEHRFPSLIDLNTLQRAGYLESFPHQLNFLSHLPEQTEIIERFKARAVAADRPVAVPLDDTCASPACAMSPTVCYHFYHANAGRILAEGMLGVTAASPCYRYEGKPTTGLRRLREFTMREIMFLGTAEDVVASRERLCDCLKRMLELCRLQSVLETASDPFFLDDGDKRRLFQMSFDLKYEARAYLPDDEAWLAIGSVNHHLDHFGRAFDITLPSGEPAHSCCLGFGLDRWCLAVFAQYGLDPECWPTGLRALLSARKRTGSQLPATEGSA